MGMHWLGNAKYTWRSLVISCGVSLISKDILIKSNFKTHNLTLISETVRENLASQGYNLKYISITIIFFQLLKICIF